MLLQKKGERNYAEFDISKSKEFKRAGSVELRLKKANSKHQYADLELMVNDRNLSQKHVNLFQPVMFYMPDSPQPVEIVINDIGKDHIHGYVSTSKYRQSELASMSNPADNSAQDANQATGRSARAAQEADSAPVSASGHRPSSKAQPRACVSSAPWPASANAKKPTHRTSMRGLFHSRGNCACKRTTNS